MRCNSLLQRRHLKLRRSYLEKCRKLTLFKLKRDKIALEYCKEKVSPQFFKLLCCQIRNSKRDPRGYRYTPDELSMFLDWYERGPKLYRVLGWIRPDKTTLRTLLRGLKIAPGINEAIMEALTFRVSLFSEEEKEVSLLMDGINIKYGLVYNTRLDKMTGLVHLSKGEIRFELAQEALVFLVRSIHGTWKQAVAFYYVNGRCTGADYAGAVLEVIQALQKTGLKIRVLINDGLSKNKTALEELGASYNEPWFYVNDQMTFAFYDYVHCMKNMRNNLMLYLLRLSNGKIIDFQHIKNFVEMDMLQPHRLAPKVTKAHIEPNGFQKQRVPLATQLFSNHVAAGMSTYALMTDHLPQEAMATANFVSDMNDLFDSLNGTKIIKDKPLKSMVTKGSPHLALWERWATEMESWEFIGSRNITFDKQWAMTLRGAIILAKAVLEGDGRPSFPMGHLNQDSIENFFSGIREKGGNRTNPNPEEFESAYATSLINSLTYSRKLKGKNCSDDSGVSLLHLKELLRQAKEVQEREKDTAAPPDIFVVEEDEDEEAAAGPSSRAPDGLEAAALSSDANSIVMNFLKKVKCDPCTNILLEECAFPRHFNSMMLSNDPTGKYSSALVVTALNEITEEGCEKLPALWMQGRGVLHKFVKTISNLPSVQLLQLCPEHSAIKIELLKLLAHEAIRSNMKWSVEQLKPKKKEPRKCKKLQMVQHC